MRRVGHEYCIYLMMFPATEAHHIVHDDIWTKDLRQIAAKFVPICWKMTRNKTNLLCTRDYKNRPKMKEISILSSEQEMKAGFMAMIQEQSNSHPSGESSSCHPRELRQMKSYFKSILSVFLSNAAILQKEFFLQCQPVNQQFCIGVLRVFMEAVGRKCLTSGIHRTGFCIMTTHHVTQIWGFFWCPTKKRWWWYLASVLLHPSLRGFWFS